MGAAGSRTSGSGAGVVPQVGRGFRGGGILPRRDGGWLGRRPHRKLGTLERKKYEVRSKKCGGRPEAAFFHGPPEGRTALLPFYFFLLTSFFFCPRGKKNGSVAGPGGASAAEDGFDVVIPAVVGPATGQVPEAPFALLGRLLRARFFEFPDDERVFAGFGQALFGGADAAGEFFGGDHGAGEGLSGRAGGECGGRVVR